MQEGFNQEKAIAAYTDLMRYIQAGAYDEHEPDGSYGPDGIEKDLANLEDKAAMNGLKFVGSKEGTYHLEAMTDQETMEYQAARMSGVIDCAKERVAEDMPYVIVGEVRPYQYHFQSQRWYVEVDVQHHDANQGAATVLCRVWLDKEIGFLKAIRVSVG
jgi:hypothetical protein